MHAAPSAAASFEPQAQHLRLGYLVWIAAIAALGGFLFGYDWVVIGGAKPFYEAYFHLTTDTLIGWANSCALVGCLAGSLLSGMLSDRLGRKRSLLLAGALFAVSSVLTGWAFSFSAFVGWRIVGGLAIGLASNISPMYIAEISPAQWRGRFVSLNQLAIVCGILGAQIFDWQIGTRGAALFSGSLSAAAWDAQYGWRWMFTAVAVPAVLLFVLAGTIPESPRWLVSRERVTDAEAVLAGMGGRDYAREMVRTIAGHLQRDRTQARGWRELASPGIRRLVLIGIGLAVLQQWSGINILFNYAEEVYRSAGYTVSDILFNIVITGAINLVFTLLAMLFVDRIGRRFLMLLGCASVGVVHIALAVVYHLHLRGLPILLLTLCAIGCYAMTLAPVTWVLITEIFPNRVRARGVSIAVSALWASSFLLTFSFPALTGAFGQSGAFIVYGITCLVGWIFVRSLVPETKGRSLEEIEDRTST
ncbi:MAG TPA: sugar porter family MFS transporter [Acidobacteriaceae bacterium]